VRLRRGCWGGDDFFVCLLRFMSEFLPDILTVTGDLGSGKSHLCRLLSGILNYKVISTGGIQRQIAEELNLTTLELNKLSETTPDIDHRIDSNIIALAGSRELICDSRLAWHFLPQSFKICLRVAIRVAAQRVLNDGKRSGESYQSVEESMAALQARRQSEIQRFRSMYQVEIDRLEHFDLSIDTSDASPEAIAALILSRIRQAASPQSKGLLWIPLGVLSPGVGAMPPGDWALLPDAAEWVASPLSVRQDAEGCYQVVDGGDRLRLAEEQGLAWMPTRLLG
jgi:cytidylate kinase